MWMIKYVRLNSNYVTLPTHYQTYIMLENVSWNSKCCSGFFPHYCFIFCLPAYGSKVEKTLWKKLYILHNKPNMNTPHYTKTIGGKMKLTIFVEHSLLILQNSHIVFETRRHGPKKIFKGKHQCYIFPFYKIMVSLGGGQEIYNFSSPPLQMQHN